MKFLNLYLFIFALYSLINTNYSMYSSNNTCDWCTDVVNIIKAEMKVSNSSINILEKLMNASCHMIIIKPEREECLDIVRDIQNITKWIIDGLYPKDICIKLHLCPNSTYIM